MSCNLFQYAVKLIHGDVKVGSGYKIGFGSYFSNVNVHNPWRHQVKFAVKIAISGEFGKPGPVTLFKISHIGPDEVINFGKDAFENILLPLNMPDFLEAYLVIECCEELDVVGVYTGSIIQDGKLSTMHMERVPARLIPVCTEKETDISTGIANWRLTTIPIDSIIGTGLAPICNPKHGAWANPPRPAVYWLGTKNDTKPGDYIYELHFNLSWEIQNSKITGKLWADNSAIVYLNNIQCYDVPANAYAGSGIDMLITDHFVQGDNILKVVVKNAGDVDNPSSLMIDGKLIKCC
jgi:hypothetical protein